MNDAAAPDAAPGNESRLFGFVWLLIGLGFILLIVMRSSHRPADAPSLVGQPLPPLNVAGWLNSDMPVTDEAVRGKVVLVDCWASWCGPCREEMPQLVKFYKPFRNQGVVLIGLTPSDDEVADIESFVKSVDGFDWPVGYGADMPLEMLGVKLLPTLILFNKQGRAVWAGHEFDGLEDAVVAALAASESH